jgi:hypothetical protein
MEFQYTKDCTDCTFSFSLTSPPPPSVFLFHQAELMRKKCSDNDFQIEKSNASIDRLRYCTETALHNPPPMWPDDSHILATVTAICSDDAFKWYLYPTAPSSSSLPRTLCLLSPPFTEPKRMPSTMCAAVSKPSWTAAASSCRVCAHSHGTQSRTDRLLSRWRSC